MSAHSRRRWFRFSLRTLFVLVTVSAVWLGWQVHTVRKREQMRSALLSRGVYCFENKTTRPVGASLWIRNRIFGDVDIEHVHLPRDEFTEQEANDVRELFLEANVVRGYGRWVP